jgi:hypothetical protein
VNTLRTVMNVLACNIRATHRVQYQCNNVDTPTTAGVQFRWNSHHDEISKKSVQFLQHSAVPVVSANRCLLFLRQVWDSRVGENLDWGRQGKKMKPVPQNHQVSSKKAHGVINPKTHNLKTRIVIDSRSQWPRGLRLRSQCIRVRPIFYSGVHWRHRQKKTNAFNL